MTDITLPVRAVLLAMVELPRGPESVLVIHVTFHSSYPSAGYHSLLPRHSCFLSLYFYLRKDPMFMRYGVFYAVRMHIVAIRSIPSILVQVRVQDWEDTFRIV